MSTARVRIGRIVPKDGSAELRQLTVMRDRVPRNKCSDLVQDWASNVLSCERPPDAVLAVAFVYNKDGWDASVIWDSAVSALPHRLLPVWAERTVQGMMTAMGAERRVMESLGYIPVDPGA